MAPAEMQTEEAQDPALRTLTGEEQALYDRQIRLWGVEAQQKLASSAVLIIGDPGSVLSQEIAKNVLLAGVARLVLYAMEEVDASRGESNVGQKLRPGFLGENGNEVVERLHAMNPLVDVSIVQDKPPLETFNTICMVGARLRDELLIARESRAAGAAFMCGRVAGEVGWVFVDAGRSNADYHDCIDGPWGGEVRRGEFGWHVARTLLAYEEDHGIMPSATEDDLQRIIHLYERFCAEKGGAHVKTDIVVRAARASRFVLPPVASVVGGLWGREIIKIISARGEPLDGFNFFFFNAASSKGSVERIKPRV